MANDLTAADLDYVDRLVAGYHAAKEVQRRFGFFMWACLCNATPEQWARHCRLVAIAEAELAMGPRKLERIRGSEG